MRRPESPPSESRVRRLAAKAGLALHKSRRDGTYQLVEVATGSNAAQDYDHPFGFGLSLEDVAAELAEGLGLDEY